MRLFTLHASGTFFYHTRGLALLFFCCDCFFCLALLFCVGALLAAAFISLPTSLYKHHEAAICLEHIYRETP
jgi:hypothetical protein